MFLELNIFFKKTQILDNPEVERQGKKGRRRKHYQCLDISQVETSIRDKYFETGVNQYHHLRQGENCSSVQLKQV